MVTQSPRTGGIIGGSILIGLGVLFLFQQYFDFMAWRFMGPFISIGIGALFFVGMVAGGKPAAGLAIPGSILGVIGLTSLLQTLTTGWHIWSYGWTLIIISVGLGIWIAGYWGENAHQRQSGWRVMKVGFVLFIIFGTLFELVLGFGGAKLRQVFFPILLIAIGGYLLLTRLGLWPGGSATPANPPDSTTPPPSEPPSA